MRAFPIHFSGAVGCIVQPQCTASQTDGQTYGIMPIADCILRAVRSAINRSVAKRSLIGQLPVTLKASRAEQRCAAATK